jgi:glycosyltransferase involved in cell wall biosynthesis
VLSRVAVALSVDKRGEFVIEEKRISTSLPHAPETSAPGDTVAQGAPSPEPVLLSVLVPVYNEEEFVGPLLERVLRAPLPAHVSREIIVVDDASTDDSLAIVQSLAAANPDVIRLVRHPKNRGKGAAIRTALEHARGEFSIIQDADLEYDPAQYDRMIGPLLEGKADAVYGSRFMVVGERRVLYYWHYLANRALTELCNLVSNLNLTDMESCYKAFRTSLAQSIPLRSNRFGIEPELTIKLARRQVRIYETPISYHGRTYEEGKKIGLKDAFQALYVILRYSVGSDIYNTPGPETLHALAGAPKFNAWMADTIRPFLGQKVLEIGAGIGNLTRTLAKRRKHYVATDIDREHLARMATRFQHRHNLEIRYCDLTDPGDFRELRDRMDTAICLNVLEHIAEDVAALRNIHSALEPGGRAIVLVPEGQSIYGTLDEAVGHYRRYSKEELKRKMEEAGFQVERILDFNRVSRPGWFVSGRWLKKRALGLFQMKAFDRGVWLWRRVDRLMPWRPTSIIAIAVKPGR